MAIFLALSDCCFILDSSLLVDESRDGALLGFAFAVDS
jgi:hypothetical protein